MGLGDDFEEMIAAGFGVEGAEQVECVFVDITGGHGAHLGMRVSALVNLLSSGADWDHVGEQTGFAPTWRSSTASGDAARGIGVELQNGTTFRFDPFANNSTSLAAVLRTIWGWPT